MEEQAFRQAVEDHRDVVFRIALTYLRDRADADDVAQDVFLKLLKSDVQFESWEHLRRWLIRVTINECKSLFRKPWRRVEDIENLAESLSTAQDETKAVLSDVMRLPERFRISIVLYYYLGFSTSEIAELLHVPAATVKSNQIKQAFESVQADSDLADRVLYAAAGEPLRRKGHAKPLYVAVIGCLAGVLATGGVAYAVVNSSYFASAWGNHGNGESVTWTNGGSSGTKYTYTREFGDGIAPQSLEGAVQKVNLSVEGNGYTLDIHEMAIDENGCGAVTFTLSNPNGVNYYKPAAELGELVLYGEEEGGVSTPSMNFGEEWADTRCTIDKDTSSDTVINGTMYFASWNRDRDLRHAVTWNISWTEGKGEDAKVIEVSTPEFNVGAHVDTKELRSDDSPLEISPFSIQTHIDDLGYEAVDHKLTVTYKDGSEQIIEDDDAGAYNFYVSMARRWRAQTWCKSVPRSVAASPDVTPS